MSLPPPQQEDEPMHAFESIAGKIVCQHCSLIVRSWPAARSNAEQRCTGVHLTFKKVFDDPKGHHLVVLVVKGLPILACQACGSHTTQNIDYLAFSCRTSSSTGRAGKAAARRLLRGPHPDPRAGAAPIEEQWVV